LDSQDIKKRKKERKKRRKKEKKKERKKERREHDKKFTDLLHFLFGRNSMST